MKDLSSCTPHELLALHARICEELRARGLTRSSNNPVGDLAEYMFCKAFNWTRAGNSNPNIDAIDKNGLRYQIKARRLTRFNKSRQLSAMRDFAGNHFDLLAGILFCDDYKVLRAAIIPYSAVQQHATFVEHTNSYKFLLHDDIWNVVGVRDVTAQLLAVNL